MLPKKLTMKYLYDTVMEAVQELDKERRETEIEKKALEIVRKDTEDSLKNLKKEHGDLANNIADTAEDAFYYNLEETRTLGQIKFDEVLRNVRDYNGKEYGVMLKNGKSDAVVEVKHKVHIKDIDDMLERVIPNFRKGFPQTEGKQVYGAIAGMSFPPDFKQKAEEAGLFVLTQNGKNIKVGNSRGFKPKAF